MSHRYCRRGRNWLLLALTAPLTLVATAIPGPARAHADDLTPIPDAAYGSDPLQRMDIYPASGPAPAVIVVHGGGWRAKDKLDPPIRNAAESLAADGFAVFNIDFRQSARNQPGFPLMTDDIAAAAVWIQQNGAQYGADTTDINLIGGSSGAQLVALAGQLMNVGAPGMIDKVVSLSGPMDFVEANHPTDGTPPPGDDDHPGTNTYLGCVPSRCTADQERLPSPFYNIDPVTCPSMLLINSADDKLVPVTSQPARMRDAMVGAGCDGALTVVPGTEHGFKLFPSQHAEITAYFRGDPPPGDLPVLSLTGATVTESVDATAELTIVADRPAETDISVDYATADGTAVAGADYVATTGTMTLPAGSTTASLFVTIVDDPTVEPTEQFTVNLTNPVGATIATSSATVTINDPASPPPTVSGVTPSALGQGATEQPVTIAGDGFTADSTVEVSGSGVRLTGQTLIDAQTLAVTVAVDRTAATGNRTVTVTVPGAGAASCSCMTVNVKPRVTTAEPGQLGTGASNQVLTMTGSGFTPDTKVGFTGAQGVSAETNFVSTTTLSVSVSVAQTARVGAYSIVLTNPDGGNSTCSKCFTVTAGPAPVSVTPDTLVQGSTTTVAISGANFQTGAQLVLPPGVTATDVSVTDTTTITAVLTVAPRRRTASGLSITVTNPGGGGAGSCNCLTITK